MSKGRDRMVYQRSDGKWVKTKTSWKSELSGANLKRFIQINKGVLKKSGYISS